MPTKIQLIMLALALGAAPAVAGALSGKSPAGQWYDVTHEDRDAWIAHIVDVAVTDVPRDRLGPQVRDCIRETAEYMEQATLSHVSSLCIMSAR